MMYMCIYRKYIDNTSSKYYLEIQKYRVALGTQIENVLNYVFQVSLDYENFYAQKEHQISVNRQGAIRK